MNDPTRNTMPGVRDFELRIPFQRAGVNDETTVTTEMRVRVPAANVAGAIMLGIAIATHVGSVNKPNAGPRWRPAIDQITATDVDDSPSPADLAAQLDHYRRIMAALATKMPMLIQVTADEYQAADPDSIQLMMLPGDTVAFATTTALNQMADLMPFAEPMLMSAEQQMMPGDPRIQLAKTEVLVGTAWHHVLMWNGQTNILTVRVGTHDTDEYEITPGAALLCRARQPAPYGGQDDPDVRTARAENLAKLPTPCDLLHDRSWVRIADVHRHDSGVVTVQTGTPGQTITLRDPEMLCTVRPAATEGHGTDVHRFLGQQILTDDGWWTIDMKSRGGTPAGRPVSLSLGGDTRHVMIGDDDEVLLRQVPDGWM